MKTVYYVSLLVLLFVFAQESMAQDATRRTRQRPSAVDTASVFDLTERARIKNEVESKKPSHIVWERLIYRNIDLTKETNNAALYYPLQPQGGRQNLFTLIVKLLADNKIKAYDYSDGNEVFEENKKLNVEDLLARRLQIQYTKQGDRFVMDERDIPGTEATQYMIKEGYYFDQATGMFQTKVLALCPILVRYDYYGDLGREALCWLKYDDLRPYLSREMIMTSNYNNALTYTIDDYFRKNMYTGEIVKTVNMMGKSLEQEVGNNPDTLKHARDSIEAQLQAFNKGLWVYNDSVHPASEKVQEKKVEKTKTASVRTSGSRNTKEKAQKAPKAQSAPKSESVPVRSVRRTR